MKIPNGLLASIRQERKMLSALYEASDYVIDTSHLTAQGLLQELKEIYAVRRYKARS